MYYGFGADDEITTQDIGNIPTGFSGDSRGEPRYGERY